MTQCSTDVRIAVGHCKHSGRLDVLLRAPEVSGE